MHVEKKIPEQKFEILFQKISLFILLVIIYVYIHLTVYTLFKILKTIYETIKINFDKSCCIPLEVLISYVGLRHILTKF